MAEPWRINPLNYLFGPRVSEPMGAQDPQRTVRTPKPASEEGSPLGRILEDPITVNVDPESISTDNCLWCGDLSVEMKKRAEPIAQVLEIGVQIDAAIITFPLALGSVGGATLGLQSGGLQAGGLRVSQAGTATATATTSTINWLVTDQLGTPRMIIDKTGSLTNVRRHDYLPFGEELVALQGLRTTALGYSGDTFRQKFTLKRTGH